MNSPTQYLDGNTHFPASPDDFIGGARKAAADMVRTLARHKARDWQPLKLLYAGASGTGKTTIAHYAQKLLGVSRWALHEVNGTDVSIETVREWGQSMRLCHDPAHGEYRLFTIHESDKMSAAAQVGFLSLMDRLPPRNAVICTTNITIGAGDKVERERFQTRFKYTEIVGPEPEELAAFLVSKFGVPVDVAGQIAAGVGGNVRAALLEAEEYLDSQSETL